MPPFIFAEIPEILQSILDSLLTSLNSKSDESLGHLTSRFMVMNLGGLLISQLPASSERQQLIDKILGILLSTSINLTTTEIQKTCLLKSIHLLLPPLLGDSEVEEENDIDDDEEKELGVVMDEEVCHYLVNPLAVQKVFCLVGLGLRNAWITMKATANPSAEQAALEGKNIK